jgi:hypothetical protein
VVDQLALAFAPSPGLGHNQPPEPIDPAVGLCARLGESHADLLLRFRDLELACARVPDPIASEEDAATATDFIAQCQVQIRQAEAAHKREKEPFLKSGRAVDTFFKRRCDQLTAALAPAVARLKAYRDQVALAECRRHEAARQAAEQEACRAAAEAEAHRAQAERLASAGQSLADRRQAAEALRLAEEATERAAMAGQQANVPLEPTRIRGDYGATAYVIRSWSFEVVDLDRVPREYMSLDVAVVREAIIRDGVREIPGLRIFQAEALRVRGAL